MDEERRRMTMVFKAVGEPCPGYQNPLTRVEVEAERSKYANATTVEEIVRIVCSERINFIRYGAEKFGEPYLTNYLQERASVTAANGFLPWERGQTPPIYRQLN